MLRLITIIVIVVTLPSLPALAGLESNVVKVDAGIRAESLWSMGLLFLADLGETYLVQGDDHAVARLSQVTSSFEVLTTVERGRQLFLLREDTLEEERASAADVVKVIPGVYLAGVERHAVEDITLLPFPKLRLLPRRFAATEIPGRTPTRMLSPPKPEVEAVVSLVSGDSLWKYISQLSGNEPVMINGVLDTLLTRYSYSWRVGHAADYLRERFEGFGYATTIHEYVMGKYNFYGGDFVDDQNGWVVGSGQRVYRTRDGGLTWLLKKPSAMFQEFYGACFSDTLEGWIVGSNARIYHTVDGGDSWTRQYAPGGFSDLNAVCFLDSLNGWVVGAAGKVAQTDDRGGTWNDVPSGISAYLSDLDFRASDRGWVCGADGVILFWDGTVFSSKTSGTTEWLYGVDFVNDNLGWVAGANRTILKTIDGGQTWVPQVVPAEVNPDLMDVCFKDSLNGWVTGFGGTALNTTDGGTTWNIVDSGTLLDLWWIEFVDSSTAWIAGEGCEIRHTADAGDTWEDQRTNLPSGAYTELTNVVATKPGTLSDEQVIICGHYDSTSEIPYDLAPGADDNASGCSAVLEAARVMAAHHYRKTIKFIVFSGHEQGIYGSTEYAGDARRAGDVITAALNFDMIGYRDSVPEDIDLLCNPASEWLTDFTIDCANTYVPGLGTTKRIDVHGTFWSDHVSFYSAGYCAQMANEDIPNYNPNVHRSSDTLGYLTQSFATDVAKLGVATLAELAEPDTSAGTGWQDEGVTVVSSYPNPFSAATTISFMLRREGRVEVSVFDVKGRLVRSLVQGTMAPGLHEIAWDRKDRRSSPVSPGVYFARVKTSQSEGNVKVVVLQ